MRQRVLTEKASGVFDEEAGGVGHEGALALDPVVQMYGPYPASHFLFELKK